MGFAEWSKQRGLGQRSNANICMEADLMARLMVAFPDFTGTAMLDHRERFLSSDRGGLKEGNQ